MKPSSTIVKTLFLVAMITMPSWAQDDGSDPTDDWGTDPTDGEVSPTDDYGEPTTTDDWGTDPTTTDDWSDPTDTADWDTTTTEWWETTSTTEWWQTTTTEYSSWSDPAATPTDQPSEPIAPESSSTEAPQPSETTQPEDPNTDQESTSGGSNKNAIIGGVVGGVGGALVIGAVAFFFIRRKRSDRGDVEEFQPQNEYDEPRTSWFSEGTTPNTPGTSMSQPFIQQLQLGGSRSSMPAPPPPQHQS
ncbi:hypothetical protein BDA99DRAFT_344198 [Phascolomyces articulosus]|uniref:Mid2 domain-containing protein n=1 Tax=Phascolomyces articulosus TaxID=60185 RepID=A0AAD5KFJ4_9FUNG|nr:hypothetical protein BDA99DRAFT_344198 [Phascolomyces articulosus]